LLGANNQSDYLDDNLSENDSKQPDNHSIFSDSPNISNATHSDHNVSESFTSVSSPLQYKTTSAK
jgi:hypothetical protein